MRVRFHVSGWRRYDAVPLEPCPVLHGWPPAYLLRVRTLIAVAADRVDH
ncbi:MAG TPA: hypothetical protein VFR23_17930 [Jiangellaceae bacterium]|nr:hypothetical protein [Jiangellaceae bacterium]